MTQFNWHVWENLETYNMYSSLFKPARLMMKDCTAILDGEFEILRVTPDLYDDAEEVNIIWTLSWSFR